MADSTQPDGANDAREDAPRLPQHLSTLVGVLSGPPDLGRNHDKYLAYPDREEPGGAASASGTPVWKVPVRTAADGWVVLWWPPGELADIYYIGPL